MGNNCVAEGGCSHRIDIVVCNNTKYGLSLDQDQQCGRDCQHRHDTFLLAASQCSQMVFRPPQPIIRPQFSECFFTFPLPSNLAKLVEAVCVKVNQELWPGFHLVDDRFSQHFTSPKSKMRYKIKLLEVSW